MDPINTQRQRVEDLYKKLQRLNDDVRDTKYMIQEESAVLQALCFKKGHVYKKYNDDDYHHPSYYYVCDICKHYRTTRPPA